MGGLWVRALERMRDAISARFAIRRLWIGREGGSVGVLLEEDIVSVGKAPWW